MSQPVLTKSQRELVAFLFGSQRSTISARLTQWIFVSPRYAAFVNRYRDKIRKKVRVTRQSGAAADLLYELQVPYWLLQEKRFEVAYEPYLAAKKRGPDYSVTFRTNFTFNIEITHVRGRKPSASASTEDTGIDLRLVDVLCGKLRQMLPSMANVLFVVAGPRVLDKLDLAAHLSWIKEKAERSDPSFYARQRFLSAADFFKHYQRLSGLATFESAGLKKHALWVNPQARIGLPAGVVNTLERGPSL